MRKLERHGMSHECSCGYAAFNNSAHSPSICPECGEHLSHYEQNDYDPERERDHDDEDR